MSILDKVPVTQESIPDWAPTISNSVSLSEIFRFNALAYDYAEMVALMEQEGVAKEHLNDLHIHLAKDTHWDAYSFFPGRASFISNSVLRSSLNGGYNESLRRNLLGYNEANLGAKSFVLVDVNPTLIGSDIGTNELDARLRLVLIHELLHFAEYIKNKDEHEKALGVITALGMTSFMGIETREQKAAQMVWRGIIDDEEYRVTQKEREIARTGVFGRLLTASIDDIYSTANYLDKEIT